MKFTVKRHRKSGTSEENFRKVCKKHGITLTNKPVKAITIISDDGTEHKADKNFNLFNKIP